MTAPLRSAQLLHPGCMVMSPKLVGVINRTPAILMDCRGRL
jgi:hypothetical protein